MIGAVVVSHGELATGLVRAAEIIVDYLDAYDADLVEASLSPTRMRVDYQIGADEVAAMAALMHRHQSGEGESPDTAALLMAISAVSRVRHWPLAMTRPTWW